MDRRKGRIYRKVFFTEKQVTAKVITDVKFKLSSTTLFKYIPKWYSASLGSNWCQGRYSVLTLSPNLSPSHTKL